MKKIDGSKAAIQIEPFRRSSCGVISIPLGQRTPGRPIAPRKMASNPRRLSNIATGNGSPLDRYSVAPTENSSNSKVTSARHDSTA